MVDAGSWMLDTRWGRSVATGVSSDCVGVRAASERLGQRSVAAETIATGYSVLLTSGRQTDLC